MKERGGIKIPPRTPLSWPRLGGFMEVDVWVTAGINPAYRRRWALI
jgi:hypothetical protein